MRIIEHRRHTMRVKPGQHLSQEGVDLARKIGEGVGPFARFAQVIRELPQGKMARFAGRMFQFHQKIIGDIPDNGQALIISHGGIVEASAIGCVPDEAFATWGPACDYCEGVRFYFDGTSCKKAVLLRVKH